MENKTLKIAFWGTPEFAVRILKELAKKNITPSLIITNPDKPQGRKLIITSSPVKIWAEENNIELWQPQKLDAPTLKKLKNYDLFIVAAYGQIIPKNILDIPRYGTLNVHPSLLPKFRGPSPIESVILNNEKETGVTIMLLDEKMDHGPILNKTTISLNKNETASQLENILAKLGGVLLAKTIPLWLKGDIIPIKQDEAEATYTKKIIKSDGLIKLEDDADYNYRRIRAFDGWPGTFFFTQKNNKKIRVIIKKSSFHNEKLTIERVIPEGRKEIDYNNFLKNS